MIELDPHEAKCALLESGHARQGNVVFPHASFGAWTRPISRAEEAHYIFCRHFEPNLAVAASNRLLPLTRSTVRERPALSPSQEGR
jgi:hypothetical protein